jgi:flagellar FliL protein
MADEPTENLEGTAEAPKKKKTLLFIIIAVVLVLAGGGGYFAYTKFMTKTPAIGEVEAEKAKKAAENAVGEMVGLEPFVVNLADPQGKRYLKLKVTIELESAEMLDQVEKANPKLRDMVIMMLTSLTFEEVMTPEGKIRIRDELLERFNHVLRPNRIKNIYFTEFVIQ